MFSELMDIVAGVIFFIVTLVVIIYIVLAIAFVL